MPTNDTGNIQITVGQLWTLIGVTVGIIASLIGLLWNLILERLKRCEIRLDTGTDVFSSIKEKYVGLQTDHKNFVDGLKEHERSSDKYREGTDKKIADIDKTLGQQITRCSEKIHK
jgi:hypothetical protein